MFFGAVHKSQLHFTIVGYTFLRAKSASHITFITCKIIHRNFLLQGQTLHWIGTHFVACWFLKSREKTSSILRFIGTINENQRIEKDQRARPFCRIGLQFTKYTVCPRSALPEKS